MPIVIGGVRFVFLLGILYLLADVDDVVPDRGCSDRDAQLAATYALVLAFSTIVGIFPATGQVDQAIRIGINVVGGGSGLLAALHWVISEGYASGDHQTFVVRISILAIVILISTILIYIWPFAQQLSNPPDN